MIIDKYLPHFQFCEKHAIEIAAPPSAVLTAAMNYQFSSDPFLRSMIAVRELPARISDVIGRTRSEPAPPFSMKNFSLLEVSEGREAVFGLAGRFWQPKYGLATVSSAGDFDAFNQPGCAKLALNFAVMRQSNDKTKLTTETRVFCLDDEARRRFAPYWYLIRPVSGMIRKRMLATIRGNSTSG
ncbi:hypothetical protein [Roseixanthobacter pseudopolyaromaticivorans]|uniref:hypothetical protein n=1 Tax=Xanthobacteraceae TaxID=335928 RepID=UPI00372B2A38